MPTKSVPLKAIVPAAGLGTRLLPATKEQPKEMLPLFSKEGRVLALKPIVQQIFEHLFDFGIRQFHFIVGREKRAIEDHFTPDGEFIHQLESRGKTNEASQLKRFYRKVETATIIWVNQPEPTGFGDAVLLAKRFVGNTPFLVHAGDTCVIERTVLILSKLSDYYAKSGGATTLTLQEVEDPRRFGVAQVRETKGPTVNVERVVEKPRRPRSKLAIMALYLFNPIIFEALHDTRRDKNGELQLTDAIQKVIDDGHKVQAIKLSGKDVRHWIDIGNTEDYWRALRLSYRYARTCSH